MDVSRACAGQSESGLKYTEVAQEDRVKTAFSTPYGLFQFRVMSFGLQGVPAMFQRLIDRIIQGVEFAAAYLDDLIVFSSMFDEHLAYLRTVFERLHNSGGFRGGSWGSMEPPFGLDVVLRSTDDRLNGSPLSS